VRSPGRPRERTHEVRALESATELLLEGSVAACTVEAVSRRSGVSKPTIYRRWPHRTALAIDAFAARIDQQVPLAETGDAGEDLVQAVARLAEQYQGRDGVVFAELIAAAVLEPGTAELLGFTCLPGPIWATPSPPRPAPTRPWPLGDGHSAWSAEWRRHGAGQL
jgi:AcrR family transcriptional regulator